MLTADFFQRIAQRCQKIIVRGQDLPVQSEFDDRLCLADGRELALEIRPPASSAR